MDGLLTLLDDNGALGDRQESRVELCEENLLDELRSLAVEVPDA